MLSGPVPYDKYYNRKWEYKSKKEVDSCLLEKTIWNLSLQNVNVIRLSTDSFLGQWSNDVPRSGYKYSGPAIHMGNPDEATGSWLHGGPAWARVVIWGVNHRIKDLSLFLSNSFK